jgi:hypothetical protein
LIADLHDEIVGVAMGPDRDDVAARKTKLILAEIAKVFVALAGKRHRRERWEIANRTCVRGRARIDEAGVHEARVEDLAGIWERTSVLRVERSSVDAGKRGGATALAPARSYDAAHEDDDDDDDDDDDERTTAMHAASMP